MAAGGSPGGEAVRRLYRIDNSIGTEVRSLRNFIFGYTGRNEMSHLIARRSSATKYAMLVLAYMIYSCFGSVAYGQFNCISRPRRDPKNLWQTYYADNRCGGEVTINITMKDKDGRITHTYTTIPACKSDVVVVQTFNETEVEFDGFVDSDEAQHTLCGAVSDGQNKASSSSTPSKRTGSALANELQQARLKADEARAKTREAAAKAAQKRNEEEAEKKRLKKAADQLPSWCQGMIRACEQRAASLANSSSETESQCKAYCQNLEIEKCNASSTVQQAAQACTAAAERDQRAAARRAQAAAEARRAQAAREEAEQIPPGWIRCPCPDQDMFLVAQGRAKLIRGVLYHPRDVGPCGGD